MTWHQIRSLSHRRRLLAGEIPYIDRALACSPILYYPMNETAGAAAVNAGTLGTAANGAYTGVTLNSTTGPDGINGAPYFDGANDYLDAYSAALAAAFSGTEGSLLIWARVANAGVWSDGILRSAATFRADAGNYARIEKSTVANRRRWIYTANADVDFANQDSVSDTGWACYALTWSDSADQAVAYIKGAAAAAAMTPIGTWAGALDPNRTLIGADTKAPANVFHGWLAHCMAFDYVLTPDQALNLSTI